MRRAAFGVRDWLVTPWVGGGEVPPFFGGSRPKRIFLCGNFCLEFRFVGHPSKVGKGGFTPGRGGASLLHTRRSTSH